MKILKMLKESFIVAWQAVVTNKLRTLLSLLGITIGIFAIISVFTIVDSLERNIRESVSSLGDDVMYIQKWPWSFGGEYRWWDFMKRPVPSYREYEAIRRQVQLAEAISFSVSTRRDVSYKANRAEDVVIFANSYDLPEIRTFDIQKGRYFSPLEAELGRNVAVIGYELAEDLFPRTDPIGKDLRIGGKKVYVVGITKKEGKSLLGGGSFDDLILLPVNFARNIFDTRSDRLNPMIMVKAREGIPNLQLKDELRMIMRNERRLKPKEEDDFALNQASLISQGIDQIFIVINLAGWIIGGFSILVGGFGIANIMFVSVKERTRIIGIQKALGAKNYFILLQFLYESVLLALTGGIIGLFLVLGGTLLVSAVSDFSISLTLGNIILGLFVSSIIGIISGFAPAYSASRLNPVNAMNSTF